MRFPGQLPFWREFDRLKFGLVPGAFLLGGILLGRSLGLLQSVEWKTLDLSLRSRPPETPDRRVVIIGIDEEDIQRSGTYPIPDRTLAEAIRTLQKYRPRAIGLDITRDLPVEPGYRELSNLLRTSDNIIGIEKVLAPSIRPPQVLTAERVGFSDAIPDRDGRYRRAILGMPSENGYKFSFTLRIAERYLKKEKITLENGIQDPATMRFGSVELPRFTPNFGGYVGADAGGLQVMVNYRTDHQNFRRISLRDLQNGKFDPRSLEGRAILIGITAPSIPDFVNTGAVRELPLPGQIYGVEFQAHVVSQILDAVLDDRPLLRTWGTGWEYLWIVFWGAIGLYIGRLSVSPLKNLLVLLPAGALVIGISFAFLEAGWWIPLAPALLALGLNGTILTAFYQYDRALRLQIRERQQTIENTFTLIHNGPLQHLAVICRSLEQPVSPERLFEQLRALDREIREIGEYLQQQSLSDTTGFRLGSGLKLDLARPIHELFYEVYRDTLARDFPCFQTLKVRVRSFDPIEVPLSIERKRQLCQFLEEALCNIGKHANGVKRVSATGRVEGDRYTLTVQDNGSGNPASGSSRGTRQFHALAKSLRGQFIRESVAPTGTVCRLTWRLTESYPGFRWFRNVFREKKGGESGR